MLQITRSHPRRALHGWSVRFYDHICQLVWVKTTGALYLLLLYLRKDVRVKENSWDFGLSTECTAWASRFCWLDGQQAAKLEVLNDRKLLQTLENRQRRRKRFITAIHHQKAFGLIRVKRIFQPLKWEFNSIIYKLLVPSNTESLSTASLW